MRFKEYQLSKHIYINNRNDNTKRYSKDHLLLIPKLVTSDTSQDDISLLKESALYNIV